MWSSVEMSELLFLAREILMPVCIILIVVFAIANQRSLRKANKKIDTVYVQTNSLVDELVATTKSEAHAAGIKEEQDREASERHKN